MNHNRVEISSAGIPEFDELDPCCQRELLQKRREVEIKARLRTTDPSLAKEAITESVFHRVQTNYLYTTCKECAIPSDYPLLASLKLSFNVLSSSSNKKPSSSIDDNMIIGHDIIRKKDRDESSSDDSDFDDDFLSPYEQELRQKFLDKIADDNFKSQIGLRIHIKDTSDHIFRLIKNRENVVIHVYDPNEHICAELDLSLEQAALKHTSTRFRRLPLSTFDSEHFALSFNLPLHTVMMVCFVAGSMSSYTTDLAQLVPDGEIGSEFLYRFLGNSKVLEESNVRDLFLYGLVVGGSPSDPASSQGQLPYDEEDRGDEEHFCDVKGCGKKYVHSHIGSGSGSHSLVGNDMGPGSEALDKDYYLRL